MLEHNQIWFKTALGSKAKKKYQLLVFKKVIWLLASFATHQCTDRQELLSSLH